MFLGGCNCVAIQLLSDSKEKMHECRETIEFLVIETGTPQFHLEACRFDFVLDMEDGDGFSLQR